MAFLRALRKRQLAILWLSQVLSGSIGAFGLVVGAYGATNAVGNLIIWIKSVGSTAFARR